MPESEKNKYKEKAQEETVLYEQKKEEILEKAKGKNSRKENFPKLHYWQSTLRRPRQWIFNQTIVGPVDELELFTEAEKQKLIAKGVPEKKIGKYKSVGGSKFNWRAARKWGVTVYGGSQNYQPCWGGLRENYEGKSGNFTHLQ